MGRQQEGVALTMQDVEHRTLRINEIDMHVTLAGQGEPLLLLHGFPDSAVLWRGMIPALVQAGFRTIAPDQRGFGLTSAPRGEAAYGIEHIVSDAIALLDALGLEKVALVGHDWGAVIGWALAARHPERFSRYVAFSVGHLNAYAAAGLKQKLMAWYILVFQFRGLAEALFRAGDFALARRWLRDPPEMAHWIADLSRPGRLTAGMNWYRANFSSLLTSRLGRVSIPVMGVWSARDVALAEEQMTGSSAWCDAGFDYRRLGGVGHWIPLEAADEAAALVLEFLQPDRALRRAAVGGSPNQRR